MKWLVVLVITAALAALGGASITFGQEGGEATPAEIEAEFGGLTRADIVAMGYVVDPFCVDASELPPALLEVLGASPTDGMGFHAGNEALFDDIVDPLEPEVILLDADDNVIGVEYETSIDTEDPSVLGQQMNLLPGGHPGMEFDHYVLHVWFIDNPSGQFADFNPALSCPEVVSIASTGTGGYLAGGSSGAEIYFALLLGIAGAAAALGGWTLRRLANR